MPQAILVRKTITGKWCGYLSPAPKMPTPGAVQTWDTADTMILALKKLNLPVIVTNKETFSLLAKYGIRASRSAPHR